MFQFCIEHGHPERDPAGRLTGWTVDSSDRYTVTTWPGRSDLIGIQREKNTTENDPPRNWPNFEKKALRVVTDYEYTYKAQKTQIRSQGGADGIQYEDPETVKYWDMRTDDAGNIFYLTWENPRRVNSWCSAARLLDHLRHNARIKARA